MDMDGQTAYDTLKNNLRIDELRLTEELIEQPQFQDDVSGWTANAQRRRDECKDRVDIAKAQAASDMRNVPVGKVPAEVRIASEILLNPIVQETMGDLRDAEFDLALWKALADAARAKKDAIRTISDLIASGYTSPTTMIEQRKRELAKLRGQM